MSNKTKQRKNYWFIEKLTVYCILVLVGNIIIIEGCSKESPQFKRGLEWMELKNYENARNEFEQVISAEPKNADARYYIAESFYLEGDLTVANNWCNETLSVDPNYAKTKELKKTILSTAEAQFLQSNNNQLLQLLNNEGVAIEPLFLKLAQDSNPHYCPKNGFELML